MKSKKANQQAPVETAEQVQTDNIDQTADSTKTNQPAPVDFMETSMVTTQIISSSASEPVDDPSLVKIMIKYPEDFAGKKFYKDGDIRKVSSESAAAFVKAGFATIVD